MTPRFQNERFNGEIPYKTWMICTDILTRYCVAGRAWMEAGRPAEGPLKERFEEENAEYQAMADAIWFAKWSNEQRWEWADINRRLNS